ncbi:MAG: hypothetical protein KDD47_02855 [Acidobacteria bacterium]|nr:hypothetical protein [Acidobacteriota bacterium]
MSYLRQRLGPALPPTVVLLTGLLLASLPVPAQGATPPRRVLFVGNSLTFYNDLPKMVSGMAAAAGLPLSTEQVVRGGETFERHVERTDDGAPLRLIREGRWDRVVLQENGRLAAAGDPSTLPAARQLVDAVRRAGGEPLFYMTWAYRDRPETLGQVHRTFYLLGSELAAPVAPVGEAWRLAREKHPEIELFDPDGVHPSSEGTYLAACVIFTLLFDLPPPEAQEVIGEEIARHLREVAAEALALYPQPFDPG